MPNGRLSGTTPRQRIERECRIRGRDSVIDGCITLLDPVGEDFDGDLLTSLAGPSARRES